MFDATKSLDDNLGAFRAECEKLDPECAKILFDNIDTLKKHGADRKMRGAFNTKVKESLEALPDPKTNA